MWGVIRSNGKAPLYPQYPVSKYIVDFGNPIVKVAVECDGREWHLDKKKDERRDDNLASLGWLTYRISGKDCFCVSKEYDNLNEYNDYEPEDRYRILSEFYQNTAEGLIKAIAMYHFNASFGFIHTKEEKLAYLTLLRRTNTPELFEKIVKLKTTYEQSW